MGEREVTFSCMSRLAASHHNNVTDFGFDMGISFAKLTKGAPREMGMDPRRLRKLLAKADFVHPTGGRRADAWELFAAKGAETFLKSLNRHVSALDLQSALHISRSQFDLLREDGPFEPDIAVDDHKPH